MGVILDSSVLIAAERGRFDLQALLSAHATETFQIAAITASELLHGCERATDPRIRDRRVRFVESVIIQFGVVPFTILEAREHARIWAALEMEGRIIGPRDMEIAATALARDCSLATRNTVEFRRIPELRLLETDLFARS